jgi:hypothetical protein
MHPSPPWARNGIVVKSSPDMSENSSPTTRRISVARTREPVASLIATMRSCFASSATAGGSRSTAVRPGTL